MKNYKNLIYLIIFIFLQIKCLDVLVEDPYYKNIQLLYEGRLLLFIYGNEQFGDYCIVDDYNYNEHSEIISDKISLSYTSKNYQYVEIEEIFNHFLYTSYKNNTNYSLKLIIFDAEMESNFNIPSNSIVPNVEVIYASEKNQFVFLEINYINIMLILQLMIM